MSGLELFILAVGLSMDAFAVSVCKGLAMKKVTLRKACLVGAWFGGFQALMPAIGCFLGTSFASYITRYDHWVAFVLLALIGANMIREALSRDEERADDDLSVKAMLVLAVATVSTRWRLASPSPFLRSICCGPCCSSARSPLRCPRSA